MAHGEMTTPVTLPVHPPTTSRVLLASLFLFLCWAVVPAAAVPRQLLTLLPPASDAPPPVHTDVVFQYEIVILNGNRTGSRLEFVGCTFFHDVTIALSPTTIVPPATSAALSQEETDLAHRLVADVRIHFLRCTFYGSVTVFSATRAVLSLKNVQVSFAESSLQNNDGHGVLIDLGGHRRDNVSDDDDFDYTTFEAVRPAGHIDDIDSVAADRVPRGLIGEGSSFNLKNVTITAKTAAFEFRYAIAETEAGALLLAGCRLSLVETSKCLTSSDVTVTSFYITALLHHVSLRPGVATRSAANATVAPNVGSLAMLDISDCAISSVAYWAGGISNPQRCTTLGVYLSGLDAEQRVATIGAGVLGDEGVKFSSEFGVAAVGLRNVSIAVRGIAGSSSVAAMRWVVKKAPKNVTSASTVDDDGYFTILSIDRGGSTFDGAGYSLSVAALQWSLPPPGDVAVLSPESTLVRSADADDPPHTAAEFRAPPASNARFLPWPTDDPLTGNPPFWRYLMIDATPSAGVALSNLVIGPNGVVRIQQLAGGDLQIANLTTFPMVSVVLSESAFAAPVRLEGLFLGASSTLELNAMNVTTPNHPLTLRSVYLGRRAALRISNVAVQAVWPACMTYTYGTTTLMYGVRIAGVVAGDEATIELTQVNATVRGSFSGEFGGDHGRCTVYCVAIEQARLSRRGATLRLTFVQTSMRGLPGSLVVHALLVSSDDGPSMIRRAFQDDAFVTLWLRALDVRSATETDYRSITAIFRGGGSLVASPQARQPMRLTLGLTTVLQGVIAEGSVWLDSVPTKAFRVTDVLALPQSCIVVRNLTMLPSGAEDVPPTLRNVVLDREAIFRFVGMKIVATNIGMRIEGLTIRKVGNQHMIGGFFIEDTRIDARDEQCIAPSVTQTEEVVALSILNVSACHVPHGWQGTTTSATATETPSDPAMWADASCGGGGTILSDDEQRPPQITLRRVTLSAVGLWKGGGFDPQYTDRCTPVGLAISSANHQASSSAAMTSSSGSGAPALSVLLEDVHVVVSSFHPGSRSTFATVMCGAAPTAAPLNVTIRCLDVNGGDGVRLLASSSAAPLWCPEPRIVLNASTAVASLLLTANGVATAAPPTSPEAVGGGLGGGRCDDGGNRSDWSPAGGPAPTVGPEESVCLSPLLRRFPGSSTVTFEQPSTPSLSRSIVPPLPAIVGESTAATASRDQPASTTTTSPLFTTHATLRTGTEGALSNHSSSGPLSLTATSNPFSTVAVSPTDLPLNLQRRTKSATVVVNGASPMDSLKHLGGNGAIFSASLAARLSTTGAASSVVAGLLGVAPWASSGQGGTLVRLLQSRSRCDLAILNSEATTVLFEPLLLFDIGVDLFPTHAAPAPLFAVIGRAATAMAATAGLQIVVLLTAIVAAALELRGNGGVSHAGVRRAAIASSTLHAAVTTFYVPNVVAMCVQLWSVRGGNAEERHIVAVTTATAVVVAILQGLVLAAVGASAGLSSPSASDRRTAIADDGGSRGLRALLHVHRDGQVAHPPDETPTPVLTIADSLHATWLLRRVHQPLTEDARDGGSRAIIRIYAAEDLTANVVNAVCCSLPVGSLAACRTLLGLTVVITGLHVSYLLLMRPYVRRFDTVVSTSLAVASFGVALVSLLAPTPSTEWDERIAVAASVAAGLNWFMLVIGVADALYHEVARRRGDSGGGGGDSKRCHPAQYARSAGESEEGATSSVPLLSQPQRGEPDTHRQAPTAVANPLIASGEMA